MDYIYAKKLTITGNTRIIKNILECVLSKVAFPPAHLLMKTGNAWVRWEYDGIHGKIKLGELSWLFKLDDNCLSSCKQIYEKLQDKTSTGKWEIM